MADEKPVITTEEHDAGVVDPEQVVGDAINLDTAVDDLASSLKLADAPVEGKPDDKPAVEGEPAAPAEAKPTAAPAAVVEDRVPDTWRTEAKEKWATVDPVVKAEIQKREADIAKYVGEAQPLVNVGQAFSKILAPFAPIFEQYKVNPLDHINGLMHAHYNLLFGKPEQKVAMLRQIAQEAQIDLRQVIDPNAQPAPQNEREQQLMSQVQQLQTAVTELRGGVTGVTSALQEARAQELSAGILAFAEDTEAHPFFSELLESGELKQLIDTGAARSLEEAYTLAELRNPTTRAKRLELDAAKRSAEVQAANATKVAAARKATAANVTSRGTGRQPAPDETIDQTLKSGLAAIHEREKK